MPFGSILLASMKPAAFWPFAVLFGFGWGGLYALLQLITVDSFGIRAAGRITGTRTVPDALGGGLGPWLTGVLLDLTAGYRIPFLLISLLILLAMLTATMIRPQVRISHTGTEPEPAPER